MLGGTIAKRWPVAVLAVAAVVAVSLGDLIAGWYSLAGHGPSAAGEYPVRVVLRQVTSSDNNAVSLPDASAVAAEEEASGEAATIDGPPTPGDMRSSDERLARPTLSSSRSAADGLLAIQFDLADPAAFDDGGSTIEIRKAVRLNGADAGNARIRVSAGSTLSIAREELGRLLAGSGQQELVDRLGNRGRFVSFDEMRRQGIEIRYDAVSDRILVSI